ncbi:uncharacterized protein LOC111276114 [Durio zibethinus]|uniref:Uncharacterized protein LOC111276114 n=1 Tax=Durio zibethinus TaxID=66656 RepID=A0A6P5WQ73_DURZI|nr:uncharacterized protein LOC111276114 [Durio zibethinus]
MVKKNTGIHCSNHKLSKLRQAGNIFLTNSISRTCFTTPSCNNTCISSTFVQTTKFKDLRSVSVLVVEVTRYDISTGTVVTMKNKKEPPQLLANLTVTQMKNYSEEKAKRYKAKSYIESSISNDIFIRIMTCETAKQAWDVFKEEFQSSDKTRQMQVLNLRREFEVLKIKESENLKEYNDRFMKIVNKIRLLGEKLSDKKIVEKVFISLLERFESKISSLKDSKDLTKITPVELFNALQDNSSKEGLSDKRIQQKMLFTAKKKGKMQTESKGRKQGDQRNKGFRNNEKKGKFSPCSHCKKTTHLEKYCWYRPDIQYKYYKQLGHIEKLEEQVFVATCYGTRTSSSAWLVDNGCTHHMASDINIFKELDILVPLKSE